MDILGSGAHNFGLVVEFDVSSMGLGCWEGLRFLLFGADESIVHVLAVVDIPNNGIVALP